MSKQANPTVIGGFVVGAVLVGVTGVFLLGGGTLFHRTHPFILYFQGDVNGLAVGSPVKFLGVQIGSVTGIHLRITPGGVSNLVPVTIRIDESVLEQKADTDLSFEKSQFDEIIEQGLRARLDTESLLTNQRYVALIIDPAIAPNLYGISELDEIPTTPTTLQQVQERLVELSNVDFQGLVEELTGTSRGLRELLESPDTKAAPAALLRTLASVDSLVMTAQAHIEPLSVGVGDASQAVQSIAGELDITLATLRATLESLRAAAEQAQEVEVQMTETLAGTRFLLAPDAPLAVQLQTTLEEFASAARSLRSLAELVERDPSALLRGKDLPRKP
jgi:paraquat-inducible protein B